MRFWPNPMAWGPRPRSLAAGAALAAFAIALLATTVAEAQDVACSEDALRLSARMGGAEACGTGRPPASNHPLDGIWQVESPGNAEVDALTIYVNNMRGILHRTDPNKPSFAHGLWRLAGKSSYHRDGFSVRLSTSEDGTVETALGQFGYCNCVKVKWRVKPTADPDVMVGEWRYKDESGSTTWRRRPREGVIERVVIAKAFRRGGAWQSDDFAYGARPGRVERDCDRRGCGAPWLSIYGENFAGAHNVWVDPAQDLEVRKGSWLCHNGKREGQWIKCGVGANPGETVAGIRFRLTVGKDASPGPINVWVDGQPIPIDLVLHNRAAAEKPNLVSLQAYDLDQKPLTEVVSHTPFVLEAVFDGDHPDDWVAVEVPLNAMEPTADEPQQHRTVTLQRSSDKTTFRSSRLLVRALDGDRD